MPKKKRLPKMLSNKRVGQYLANELMGVNAKERRKRWERRYKKLQRIRQDNYAKIRVFGWLRFRLSVLFGQWVLFAWNRRAN